MRFFLLLAFIATSLLSFAQDPADIFHKTVDVDEVDEISFNVHQNDQLQIKSWPGDDVLIETSVKINNGQPHMLKFFREKKRWDLAERVTGEKMVLESHDMVRRQVKDERVTTSETVVIVVYMPEDFTGSGDQVFRRQSR